MTQKKSEEGGDGLASPSESLISSTDSNIPKPLLRTNDKEDPLLPAEQGIGSEPPDDYGPGWRGNVLRTTYGEEEAGEAPFIRGR